MSSNEKIISALSAIKEDGKAVPFAFINYNGDSLTYITYYEMSNNPALTVDDECVITTALYSFTVFSNHNYNSIIAQLKTQLKGAGFVWQSDSADLFDEETNQYYKAIDFRIDKEAI